MKRTITYGLEEAINDIIAVRITVKTVNLGELGVHASLQQAQDIWITEKAGKHPKDMTNEEYDAMDPVLKSRYNSSRPWSYIQISTALIEVIDIGNEIEERYWRVADFKALDWNTPEGRDTIPADLFTTWDEKAQVVNPRVFGPLVEDPISGNPAEKKVGVISLG